MSIENFTRDFLFEIKQKALEAAQDKKTMSDAANKDYIVGYSMAYYEVVSLAISQATAFGVNLSDIGLEDLDPERELL